MQQWTCHIKGLDSVFGAREVERLGRQIDGVENLIVDYAGETLVLSATSRDVLKRLEKKLGHLGYKVLDKGYSVQSILKVENLDEEIAQQYIQKKIGAHSFVQKLDIRPLSKTVILNHSADFSISDFICDLNNHNVKANLHHQALVKSFWEKISGFLVFMSFLFILAGIIFSLVLKEENFSLIANAACIACTFPMLFLKAVRRFVLEKKFNYEILLVMLVSLSVYLGLWFEVAFISLCAALLQRGESNLGMDLKRQWSKIRSYESGVAFIKSINGNEIQAERVAISNADLAEGNVINVEVGEMISVDGVIVSGEGKFSDQALTGSRKVTTLVSGCHVYAGMCLLEGEVEIRLSGGREKNVSSILHRRLEALQTQITGFQTKAKLVAEYFLYVLTTVAVIAIISILLFDTALGNLWLQKIMAFMLVTSAAFVVLSIQYSYLFAFLKAAGEGLYFFRPDYWNKMSQVDTVILDKNGVVTIDKPEVQEVISLADYAIKEVLRVAASLSSAIDEPRFFSIREHAKQHQVLLEAVLDVEVIPGKSISGKIDEKLYRVGSQSVFEAAGLITPVITQKLKRWQEEGANIILVADEKRVLGLITVVDPVRPEISEFIDCAHDKLGIKVVMLSQDNAGTSQVLANDYGFDDIVSEVTEEGVESAIKNYMSEHSVMLISNRHELVVDEDNRISIVNDALRSQYIKGDQAIVSLGIRLLSALNLITMARKINARLRHVISIVVLVKVLFIVGILAGFLSFGMVIGLEFLLGYWMLFSTYRASQL